MPYLRIRLALPLLTSLLLLTAWPAAPSAASTDDPTPSASRAGREPRVPQARPQGPGVDGQFNPAAIADGSGGMIVAWEETRLSAKDIYLKSLDSYGNARWPTVAVCTATGNQHSPTIVPDGSGGVIVTWYDDRSFPPDIYAQRVLASGAVDPTWPTNGRALCTATGDQYVPTIVPDGAGGAIVTWYDYRGGNSDIYAQRVLASGAVDPAWPADGRALCTATGHQINPTIVPDGAGGAIVTWYDSRSGNFDIYAQRVLASGAVDPAWPANGRALCTATGDQYYPTIVPDGAGGAVVTWEDHRSGNYDIYAQRVLASGAVDPAWPANGRALCTATGDQGSPTIAPDGAGGAFVTWYDSRSGNSDIYAQRVLASGAVDPAWPADGRALCTATDGQGSPTIAPDGAGGAFVTWYDSRSGNFDIYAQRVLASGAVDPAWPADGLALCTATGGQESPAIVSDGRGGAIVTWTDYRGGNSFLYAARVTATGAEQPAWTVDGVALCTATGDQTRPMMIPDGLGGAIVTWVDDRSGSLSDIHAQRVLASGVVDPAWPADGRALCTAAGTQTNPTIAPDGAGGTLVTWQDIRSGSWRIYAQRVLASGAADPAWPADGRALCTAAAQDQTFPTIVTDGAGGAFVSWMDSRPGPTTDIYAQRVLASGSTDPAWPADGRALCTATGNQRSPEIASDGAGGAIVTWYDSRTDTSDIYAARVLASGVVDPAWPANGRALCTATDLQWFPVIVPDGAGGAFVTWDDSRSGTRDIYAQRVLASGAVDPAWPVNGRALSAATGDQYTPKVAPDGAGGAIVAWNDTRSGTTTDIYAQRVLANGAVDPAWPADGRALCTATGTQGNPTIVTDGAGGALVSWQDSRNIPTGYDIYSQRVLASGAVDPAWPADGRALCNATGLQQLPAIVPDGAGGAIVAWQDERSGKFDIYAQRITRSGPIAVLWTPDGVTSALLSLMSAEAGPDAVRLAWHTSQTRLEATLYRQEESGGWFVLTTLVPDDTGRLRFVDEAVTAGQRYGYRLGVRSDAGETYLGEVWLTIPRGATLSLEGSRPNPASRDLVVAFSLAEAGDATLELLDVAGRRVMARSLTGLPAGSHVVNLETGRPLAAGVYVIRLTQAGRSLTRKAVVAR